MPEVSIIIAVLNGARTIRKAIESVQAQTVRDIEIVVVDDGSTDDTYEIVSSMAATDNRIKPVRLPQNVGVSAARNAGIANSTGTWITILDADDWYEPARTEIMLKAANEYHADVVADNIQIYDHVVGEVVDQTHHDRGGEVTELTAKSFFDGDNPLRRHATGYLQPMIRRQFMIDHNIVYAQKCRSGEDFLLLSEVLLQGARAIVVPDACYVYVHKISPTTRKISPHSRSPEGFVAIFEGCDEILRKYGSSMLPEARHALERRRRIFEQAVTYQGIRAAVREHRFVEAFGSLLVHPYAILFALDIIRKWADVNVRFYLRSLGKRR
jgi:succinoglycan biosynthesis protein ExoO